MTEGHLLGDLHVHLGATGRAAGSNHREQSRSRASPRDDWRGSPLGYVSAMDVKAAIDDITEVLAWDQKREAGTEGFHAIIARMHACILRCSPAGSSYQSQLERALKTDDAYHVLKGTLMALREDLNNGRLAKFEEIVHAGVYSDLLAQGEGLARDGYHRAAAVVAGASLEEHIKKLAVKHGTGTQLANGQPKKASVMNSELKTAGIYSEAQRAIVEGLQKLRNEAAHGNPGFDGADIRYVASVQPMIDGIRAFVVQHPA